MSRISVAGLTKRYHRTLAVDDVGFEVEEGTVTGLLGRNGAGKTTTLRVLLGLVAPTAGRATIDGLSYHELPSPVSTVGAVLEGSNAHPDRSAYDHLRVIAAATGIPRRRIDEVLGVVELADAAGGRVATFSLGMKQRLGLATALLGDPAVLVLDEPTNGLDPPGVRWTRNLVRRLAGEGRTVLLSSHLLAEVAQTVDRVVILERGRLVADCPLAELTGSTGTGGRVHVRTPKPRTLLKALRDAGIQAERDEAGAVVAVDATGAQVGQVAAQAGVVVHELREEQGSLEEAFLELTGAMEETR